MVCACPDEEHQVNTAGSGGPGRKPKRRPPSAAAGKAGRESNARKVCVASQALSSERMHRETQFQGSFSEKYKGTASFDCGMLGTTSRGAKTKAVPAVRKVIESLANTEERRATIIRDLLHTREFQEALAAEGMPTRADQIITAGVAHTLDNIQSNFLHRTVIGRVANNAVMKAAVCQLCEMGEHGDQQAVAAALKRSVRHIRRASARLQDQDIFDLMDPTREERSDALTAQELTLIETAWEMFTEPAPDYVVNHFMGEGEYIVKAVHWKRHSGEEIFEKVPNNPNPHLNNPNPNPNPNPSPHSGDRFFQ